ncbi:hypothetical protein BDZ89DRAFT_1063599 [Hymenopellis radicata]|nr:hypothetical protein BDZ89DRAFT_1063599 [Hymenopellis radicata]
MISRRPVRAKTARGAHLAVFKANTGDQFVRLAYATPVLEALRSSIAHPVKILS